MSEPASPPVSVQTGRSALTEQILEDPDAVLASLFPDVDVAADDDVADPVPDFIHVPDSVHSAAMVDDETEPELDSDPELESPVAPAPVSMPEAIEAKLLEMGLDSEVQARATDCIPVIDTLLAAKELAEAEIAAGKAKRKAAGQKAARTRKVNREKKAEAEAAEAAEADGLMADDPVERRREELARKAGAGAKGPAGDEPDMSQILDETSLNELATENPVALGMQLFKAASTNNTTFVQDAAAHIEALAGATSTPESLLRALKIPVLEKLGKLNLGHAEAVGLLFYSIEVNDVLSKLRKSTLDTDFEEADLEAEIRVLTDTHDQERRQAQAKIQMLEAELAAARGALAECGDDEDVNDLDASTP